MHKVFIDGQSGTTGLQIQDRLSCRDDIDLLEIEPSQRKNPEAKRAILNEADVTILCLPDDAARETVALAAESSCRILDASTAHRVAADWVYGLPELQAEQRKAIQGAERVSNPGCYPTGFLLAIQPLVNADIVAKNAQLTINAVSGYSGGGKSMIERYEARSSHGEPWWVRPYALSFGHKHVAEMQQFSGLSQAPLFTPSVAHYLQGMLVSVPLAASHLTGKFNVDDIYEVLASYYANEACVTVHPANGPDDVEDGFLDPQKNNNTNRNDIYIFGNHEHLQVISILDNLGKGAAGAAVQNLNLMLGDDELSSLTL
ncbi:MAG: N-acetyl-gamma-glutamyl-phosphate reductase [Candidatus Azotimanducaceae bacterium]|jgi:N-acetyl-gamma-glutamyl-phosphate reductase